MFQIYYQPLVAVEELTGRDHEFKAIFLKQRICDLWRHYRVDHLLLQLFLHSQLTPRCIFLFSDAWMHFLHQDAI